MKYSCGEKLAAVFTKFGEQIASDVLATSIEEGSDDNATELDINGEKVNLSLKKA